MVRDRPPEQWPVDAIAALTTHDLPTVAGVVSGTDDPNGQLGTRLGGLIGRPIGPDDDPVEVAAAAYRRLAGAPCRLVAATLDDALGVAERPNVPGTIDEHPNWSLALPRPVEDLPGDPGAQAVAAALSRDPSS